jgi:dTDP-4-amino-4,6-dideoxygalactose transaminase
MLQVQSMKEGLPMIRLDAINDLRRHTASQGDAVRAAVARVVDSGWFILGRELQSFEAEFAAYCGSPHCIGVANGTDALELALRACGVGPGGRVLTVANAGAYSTTAIHAAGGEPVYVDVDDDTLLVDEAELRRRLDGEPVAALIVTHLYGRLVPGIDAIARAARRARVPLIEDCAQAHGARLGGRMAGSFGDVGCFSFYPTKNLGALGDGGALVTGSAELGEQLRMLRQYGWAGKYRIERAGGRNSRLDEMQAAVLRAKLPMLDGWNERRRDIARRFSGGIRQPKLRCPRHFGEDCVAHLYVVRTAERQSLQAHLRARGIASDIHYPLPDYRQPAFAAGPGSVNPVAERACDEVLTLPCFPEMTDDEVAAVVDAVNAW